MFSLQFLTVLGRLPSVLRDPMAAFDFMIALVAGVAALLLLIEGFDAIRGALRSFYRWTRGGAVADDLAIHEDSEVHQIREPDTRLRRRYFRRVRPIRRTWEGGRANDPSRHWKGSA